MKVIRIVPNLSSESFLASRDFYAAMFDLVVSVELDDWYLQLMAESDPRLNIGFVKPDHELFAGRAASSGASGVVLTIHVDDVDEAYARARELGAEIAAEIRDEDHGQRHFLVVDPNGQVLNVMSPLVAQPGVESIWVESLGRSFGEALGLLEAAIRDCTDDLWESSMWKVDGAEPGQVLAQRRSTPWSVAWHALEVLDYDLTGGFPPWSPPAPFTGKAHWRDLPLLPTAWSRSDMLGYVDHCRQRVRDTLKDLTDEKAARHVPRGHRHDGQPFAWTLTALPAHTVEHASQINQFIAAARLGSGPPAITSPMSPQP